MISNDDPYIGRSERLAEAIINILLPGITLHGQVPIKNIVSAEDLKHLADDLNKHKFDFIGYIGDNITLGIEINYKHGERAAIKWTHYSKLLRKYHITPVTINDYDCRSSLPKQKGLFRLNSRKKHEQSWNDFRDVIDALEMAGVQPPRLGPW